MKSKRSVTYRHTDDHNRRLTSQEIRAIVALGIGTVAQKARALGVTADQLDRLLVFRRSARPETLARVRERLAALRAGERTDAEERAFDHVWLSICAARHRGLDRSALERIVAQVAARVADPRRFAAA